MKDKDKAIAYVVLTGLGVPRGADGLRVYFGRMLKGGIYVSREDIANYKLPPHFEVTFQEVAVCGEGDWRFRLSQKIRRSFSRFRLIEKWSRA